MLHKNINYTKIFEARDVRSVPRRTGNVLWRNENREKSLFFLRARLDSRLNHAIVLYQYYKNKSAPRKGYTSWRKNTAAESARNAE